jgi:hypothetical protein
MSVKLSGYVFRRIHGRIIPIRKGVQLASEAVNKLAREVLSTPVSKKTLEPSKKFLVGRGADFNVFGRLHDIVMKIPRNKVGTSSKSFLRAFPETKDKVALSKAASENLANYGIPTVNSDVVRLKGKVTALVQDKVIPARGGYANLRASTGSKIPTEKLITQSERSYIDRLQNETLKINKETGLNIDAHFGNFSKQGYLIDTGLNLKASKISKVKYSDTAKDIIGAKDSGYYATKITDVKPESITSSAAEYGTSQKALKQMNKLLKEGKMFARVGDNEYKFAYRKPKLINKK